MGDPGSTTGGQEVQQYIIAASYVITHNKKGYDNQSIRVKYEIVRTS